MFILKGFQGQHLFDVGLGVPRTAECHSTTSNSNLIDFVILDDNQIAICPI